MLSGSFVFGRRYFEDAVENEFSRSGEKAGRGVGSALTEMTSLSVLGGGSLSIKSEWELSAFQAAVSVWFLP